MKDTEFNASIDSTLDAAKTMLTRKSAGYSNADDRLHNFRTAAALNGITMEKACWGMLTKHIISLRDMVQSEGSYSTEVWDEKIGDAINYLAILKAITVETEVREPKAFKVPEPPQYFLVDKGGATTVPNTDLAYSPGPADGRNTTSQQRDIDSIKRVADKHKY